MKKLDDLPKNVHERLEYIEFMLRFRGWVSRTDLTDRFSTGDAAATRDIRLYRDLGGDKNLELNPSTKKYVITHSNFKPLFELDIQQALSKIRNKTFREALGMSDSEGVLCPPRLGLPSIETLSSLTRAISCKTLLEVKYRSVKNGLSNKLLAPHSLFDNGVRWYVRAFDLAREEFRTFALTRIVSTEHEEKELLQTQSITHDHQWNRMVYLEIIPHPNRKNVQEPDTIIHDFQMQDGCLKLNIRASVVGYWLSLWNVDCTEDHSLEGYQYQLWLRNHPTLYDVESRKIAPGLADDY